MKDHKKPRTWTDSLDKRSKRKKMDMRFGTWNKVALREIGWDGMDWIDLAQNRDRWRAFMNTVTVLRVP
jgi:hypothetical protein